MDTCVVPTFLATMNNIAMNIGVQNFKTLLSILLDIYTEVELLDCMVNLRLIFFEELPYHFSQQLHQFTFPPTMT